MNSAKIDQKAYLKRYLSNDKDKKKKKKKKDKSASKSNVRIIDADDFSSHVQHEIEDENELFGLGEEAPQIVGVIDERPPELKAKEDFSSSKWKKLAADSSDAWGRKAPGLVKNIPAVRIGQSSASLRHESSPRRDKRGSDSDQSPQRRGRERSTPIRNYRRASTSQSPPRKPSTSKRKDSDESPPRKKEGDKRRYDSDHSPLRSKSDSRSRRDKDKSPPRRAHKDRRRKNSDESPPRGRGSDSDQSPPRKRQDDTRHGRTRMDSGSDISPPRRSKKSDHDRVRIKQERSPSRTLEFNLRKVKQEPSDSDESPPRRRQRSPSSDQSPPRRVKREHDHSSRRIKSERRSESPQPGPSRKMTTTLDGKRAGLQDARALKEETEKFRRRETELFDNMSADASGRYAKTVTREKSGKRRDVEEELRKEFEKRKRDDKKKEIYTRWGKGVKQVDEYKTQLEEAAHEMSKPLARYKDDEDLDEYLKHQERIGDPMLEYIRSKKKEKDRQEGRPQKPVYKGAFPDNRFGIRPGYRWDGVDRSNGFEKKWFEMMGKKKAVEEEAYKYSVEDM
ncbi:BUD13 homolog [Armigeres subalbatus]|uniref:BUD13 homolog n=1 Tax=Armigeres subalbatus TaxID=124917 RepID=UPI002ED0A304